jgi:predicted MPP superfamily phosphohydrolase
VHDPRPPLATCRSRPVLTRHRVGSPRWPGPPLTIALIADFHDSAPWTTLADIAELVPRVMGIGPDRILLGGDFLAGRSLAGRRATAREIFEALGGLSAPLGTFAILGNHDWRDCALATATGGARNSVIEALAASPFRLLRNQSARIAAPQPFWLAGFDSQRPFGRGRPQRFHDPAAAYADIPDGAPVILAAHEPDYFAEPDPRALLQLSGHTHAGQANLFGWRPLTPSDYGGRYAWGAYRDGDRHLVVSGGIGFSGLPLRIAAPPEITHVTLRGASGIAPGDIAARTGTELEG